MFQNLPFEQLLKSIIDSSDDAIVSKGLDGIVTSWNKGAEEVFGYTAEEMVGQPITRLFPADRLAEEDLLMQRIKRGEIVDHYETVRRRKSGELVHVSVTLSPLKNRDGEIVGASKIARDITMQKQAARTSALLASIVESSEDAIISKNLQGIITSWNHAATNMFGYTAEEAIGKSVEILFPADRIDEEPVIMEKIKRGERVGHFETVRITKAGDPIDVSLTISPLRDERGKIIGASKIARNITDQKKAFQRSNLLAAMVNSSDDAIVSKNLDGVITTWNKGAEKLFGYTEAEAVGKHITMLFPKERIGEEVQIMAKIRRGERIEHFETVRMKKDGTHIPISLTLSPILDSRGKIVGASKIARDITERKKAQAALELANQRLREVDRLKSEFLATMSHELRTPLNSIIGFTGIVHQELAGPLNPEQKKQLGMAYNSARHLLSLINDLLDLSRIESGKMRLHLEEFDPQAVIREVQTTMAPMVQQRGLQFTADLQLPGLIRSDRKKVYQIILNLVNNAVKFTHAGGVRVEGRTNGENISISVEDTGIGIKPDQLERLFHAFQQAENSATRRYEGTGLGLYLSQKLARMLGGEITAESQFEKGSRFTVILPRCAPLNNSYEQTSDIAG